MTETLTSRERVLKLFSGQEIDRLPCFSGMGNVTLYGLKKLGYQFSEIHSDAKIMYSSAASAYKTFGIECGVVPFDLCVEAEALGCEIDVCPSNKYLSYPIIKTKLIKSEDQMNIEIPSNLLRKGRIPLIKEAISHLQR